MNNDQNYRIRDLTKLLGMSGDTLRYYEKIGLLKNINRTSAGVRYYTQQDISRLRFIQRAKAMIFSLDEIGQLLSFRDDPQNSREETRELTRNKLTIIEKKSAELDTLRKELTLLLNLCGCSKSGCPILEDLDKTS